MDGAIKVEGDFFVFLVYQTRAGVLQASRDNDYARTVIRYGYFGIATRKAYCDKEPRETEEKNAAKTSEIEKLSTKIDQMSAKSADLKDEVAQLRNDFAELAKSQSEIDKLREEENTLYESNKADMEKGLKGVKPALRSSTGTMPRRVSPTAGPTTRA